MNRLPRAKQEQAISILAEGASIRSVERIVGAHRDTIMRLMVRVGNACVGFMDGMFRDLDLEEVQVDELWTYCTKKPKQVRPEDDPSRVGAFWAFVAVDSASKLVPCHLVSKRTPEATRAFLEDLAGRVSGRIQLSTDMMVHYYDAVQATFGDNVHYGQIVKRYKGEKARGAEGRYSPPRVRSVDRRGVFGYPLRERISTSHVEAQNLTVRMSVKRFARLSNAFSKKPENLVAAVGLHYGYYNLVRRHSTVKTAPAVAAGVIPSPMSVGDLVSLAY